MTLECVEVSRLSWWPVKERWFALGIDGLDIIGAGGLTRKRALAKLEHTHEEYLRDLSE